MSHLSTRLAPVALCTALLAACGGGAAPAAPTITGPAVDERTAERDAAGTITEIYGAINRGKPDNLFSSLDEALVVFGPRRADAAATRTDALVALGQVVDAKASSHAQVRSGGLTVVASPGGHSAWAMDVVSVDGVPMSIAAILSSEDEFFRVTTASLGLMPSSKQVRAEQKQLALVPPAAAAAGQVAGGARDAVERFQRGLADQALWGEDLARRGDAVVIGPEAGAVARGKKAIKKLWAKRLDAGTRAAVAGDIAAGVSADGQLAWVTAPITRVERDAEPLPLRAFAVFERTDAGWSLIALQEAVAVSDPGAGEAFVKAAPQPAAPAVEEPPPAKAKPEAKKPKAKAKAKKKTKKRRRDDD